MQGYEINERMRALLIDWLIQVHSRFQLLQETLYLTVAILDRFLQVKGRVGGLLQRLVILAFCVKPLSFHIRFSQCHARSSSWLV